MGNAYHILQARIMQQYRSIIAHAVSSVHTIHCMYVYNSIVALYIVHMRRHVTLLTYQ